VIAVEPFARLLLNGVESGGSRVIAVSTFLSAGE
jgi:hypothetical protein